jgi:hypothetical protein
VSTVHERQAWREAFLIALYHEVGGDTLANPEQSKIAGAAAIPADDADGVAQWLQAEGLVQFPGFGSDVSITHEGIREAEALIVSGDVPPPPIALVLTADEKADVEAIVGKVAMAREAGEMELDAEDDRQLDADLRTLEIQGKAPKPSRELVRGALGSIGRILESGTGSALFFAVQELIKRLA